MIPLASGNVAVISGRDWHSRSDPFSDPKPSVPEALGNALVLTAFSSAGCSGHPQVDRGNLLAQEYLFQSHG